ncbi:hypothetical protein J6590_090446 [Homalodisca vitripennis]|nr:hypothetical protein J6590_090446 [Homalodisca vitripennis]
MYEMLVLQVEKAIMGSDNLEILRCQVKIAHWIRRINNLKGLFKLTDNFIKEIDRKGLVAQEESLKSVELDEQLCSEIERRLSESNLETENESVALDNITKGPIPINVCNDVFSAVTLSLPLMCFTVKGIDKIFSTHLPSFTSLVWFLKTQESSEISVYKLNFLTSRNSLNVFIEHTTARASSW